MQQVEIFSIVFPFFASPFRTELGLRTHCPAMRPIRDKKNIHYVRNAFPQIPTFAASSSYTSQHRSVILNVIA
jgi:hypothetical protein